MTDITMTNKINISSNTKMTDSPERKRYKKNDPEYNKLYCEKNKDKLKAYYEKNKDKIKGRLLERVYCPCCQIHICKGVLKLHLTTAIHARFKQEFDQNTAEVINIAVC